MGFNSGFKGLIPTSVDVVWHALYIVIFEQIQFGTPSLR